MGTRPRKPSAPATPLSSEASSSSLSWSDLPPELAGLILRRFPSLADRVLFGSVCRHWRYAARQQASVLPPVFPWTINLGTVQTIPDGEVHSLCSDELASCWCSSENWLLMVALGSHDVFLQNPLSGATLPLPGTDNLLHPRGFLCHVTKFILCPDNLVVASVFNPILPNPNALCACRPGMSSWSTSSAGYLSFYEDIAFHDRNLYVLTNGGDLFVHEVSDGHGAGKKPASLLSSEKLVIKGSDPSCHGASRLLVVSCDGRLLMVKWKYGRSSYDNNDDMSAFKVFEADLQMSRWSQLSSIGDQVLFVSEGCSKAVPASPNGGEYLCGNRIYIAYIADDAVFSHCSGSTRCGMYDLTNDTYHPIVSDALRANNIGAATWFFPHK